MISYRNSFQDQIGFHCQYSSNASAYDGAAVLAAWALTLARRAAFLLPVTPIFLVPSMSKADMLAAEVLLGMLPPPAPKPPVNAWEVSLMALASGVTIKAAPTAAAKRPKAWRRSTLSLLARTITDARDALTGAARRVLDMDLADRQDIFASNGKNCRSGG
jgi:hypothetical protein